MALGVGTLTGVMLPPLLVGGVIIAAAIPSYKRAWEGIRHERKLNVDFLDFYGDHPVDGHRRVLPAGVDDRPDRVGRDHP